MSFEVYLQDILRNVSSALLVPVMIILAGFCIYALYCLGSIITEAIMQRRHYKENIPAFITQIEAAKPQDVQKIIMESGMLDPHKKALLTVAENMHMEPADLFALSAREEELLDEHYSVITARTDQVAKLAPMFGLMGTLIPLGPGIVALGIGDTETLSSSLLVAFDTTVAGLASGAVCSVVGRIRKSWYKKYTDAVHAAMVSILQKAETLRTQNHAFAEVAPRSLEATQEMPALVISTASAEADLTAEILTADTSGVDVIVSDPMPVAISDPIPVTTSNAEAESKPQPWRSRLNTRPARAEHGLHWPKKVERSADKETKMQKVELADTRNAKADDTSLTTQTTATAQTVETVEPIATAEATAAAQTTAATQTADNVEAAQSAAAMQPTAATQTSPAVQGPEQTKASREEEEDILEQAEEIIQEAQTRMPEPAPENLEDNSKEELPETVAATTPETVAAATQPTATSHSTTTHPTTTNQSAAEADDELELMFNLDDAVVLTDGRF